MSETYQPQQLEPKWQADWVKQNLFSANDNSAKPKFYCLDMFPYPSANGLHVGHPEGYTATDIVSRYQRMTGMNVLHPMGWDAFGLPAENFAIKTGVDPDTSTHNNIKNFTRQINSLGFSYDWAREVDTSSPEYYKWTQWMFLQMYQHGLAYRKKAKVNWCNGCQTVLANEQVVDGKCERSGDAVIQKDLEQWFFKITDYAEQLLNDLDTIDWPEPIKLMQRNWIGKSEGATINFQVANTNFQIEAFTTRPDTLYGATYLVLAPDHSLVNQITIPEKLPEIQQYQQTASKKTELERNSLNKEKTGVFTGAFAINPANGEQIPIWIADYVLSNYGSGAIMAVPAHDERDWDFAQKFELRIVHVVEPNYEKLTNSELLFSSAVRDGDMVKTAKYQYESIIKKGIETKVFAFFGQGKVINSGEFDGMDSEDAKWKITEKVGGEKVVKYKIRDWLISRQRYWGTPIPIVYDPAGKAHAVKEEHLPLLLPTDVDYLPKGTSPIGTSQSYKALAEKLYGAGWHFEVDTMDTFVCSAWYYLRYCDPKNTEHFAAPDKLEKWLPVDLYVGGAEHAVLHLLYARFFHKALQDFGCIPKSVGREPFKALRNQGMILGEDNQKMSKSRGNVINPDEVVNQYGADTLRLYEMFIGPFEDVKPWNTKSIQGVYRFLNRVNEFVYCFIEDQKEFTIIDRQSTLVNKTIKKVTDDIKGFKFNTAISQLMIQFNGENSKPDWRNKLVILERSEKGVPILWEWEDISKIGEKSINKNILDTFVKLLSPFAPHLAEELWHQLGHSDSVTTQNWPIYDEALLVSDTVTIVVQVNGKLRGDITAATDLGQAEVETLAKALPNVQKYTTGHEIIKVIYVPKRLVNIVIKS